MTVNERTDELSVTKRALLEIRELKRRLSAAEHAAHEPIAIVGMGLRLPGGVNDAASLWRVLESGTDTISEVPPDRWDANALYDADPDRAGTIWTRHGGFLDAPGDFDATFFGISPREAASMDPQQRLFLEVAWEALENAGIAPDSLTGSATGVFAGVGNSDYFRMLLANHEYIDAYSGLGGSASVIPGRLSYVLGLQGPSLTVDTACSASLVAVHLACESLRRGESTLGLAGGVNLILSPEAHIAFTKARMIAPDGRCKTFDEAANGYSRGEGCGVIVLRRLSDAQARRDRILAVIRGSAINQDGRSGGLTAPNGPAQEAVIRAALASAQLSGTDIDVVEAHGTGTSLGDPIEVQALGAALAGERGNGRKVVIGACKTNFGHLEAAAGIAGLAKLVVSLMHRRIPPSLHFKTPNRLVDWASLPVRVATAVEAWPETGAPGRAGVSSFGFSGTNAHVVLEEAPVLSPVISQVDRTYHLLALSARDDSALRTLGERYAAVMRADGPGLGDVCATANAGRAHFPRRAAIVASNPATCVAALEALHAGASHRDLATTNTPPTSPVVGFLFTGQGAQRAGMARTLYDTSPAYREAMHACAAALDPHLQRPIIDVLYTDGTALQTTEFAQPGLFAVEYALAALWQRWGVTPHVALGHSAGEIAAACVAGVLTLADAARLVATRGRLMQALPAGGAMASIFAERSRVEQAVRGTNGAVEIAAFNGPEHVVVTGPRADVATICDAFHAQNVKTRTMEVSHAFHSRLIEPALPSFEAAIRAIEMRKPQTGLISNVTGNEFGAQELSPAYWREHARRPVQFESSLRRAAALGVTHFVEIGPHPVLAGMGARIVEGEWPQWLPSLRDGEDDWSVILRTAQSLYVAGVDFDWKAFESDYARQRADLPTYPFQRRRYWIGWTATQPRAVGRNTWDAVARATAQQSENGPIGVDLSDYEAKWQVLARLTLGHATQVLFDAGLFAGADERRTLADVLARIGAPDTYRHLIHRWLEGLANVGALARDGDAYVAQRALDRPDLDTLWAETDAALRDNRPLYDYLRNCGRLLSDVIVGRASPLETLFPDGSFALAEALYERSATGRYINAVAARTVDAVVNARGSGTRLRVLEVGAGTGGTTSYILPVLDPSNTDYVFTDVSQAFLDVARDKFRSYPFLRFDELNIELDPVAQGFADASFDVILAANAVHATRDLPKAMERLKDLLAPGGFLVLVESTTHLAWFDMTTGLIEGWQIFSDTLRTDNPLLPAGTWVTALRAAGFARADAWPTAGTEADALRQHVVLAQKAGEMRASDASTVPAFANETGDESVPSRSMSEGPTYAERVANAAPVERLDMLRTLVRDRVIHVLRLAPDQAPGRTDRLMDLGFDSLMAVQLRNALASELMLSKPLSATLLFDYPTVDAIAEHLLAGIAPSSPGEHELPAPAPAEAGAAPLAERVSEIAAMSDADIDQLLRKRMERK